MNSYDTTPLYLQLANILKELIQNKTLPEGSKFPPEKKLCDLFDVSLPTVSNAFKKLVESGLVYQRRKKGTFVLANKENIKELSDINRTTKVTKSIGVIFPSPYKPFQEDPWFSPVMQGITKACLQNRYKLQWFPITDSNNSGRVYIDTYQNYNLKGLIIIGATDDKHINLLKRKNIPFIQIGRSFSGSTEINYVDSDHIGGMHSAVCHLVEHNYKRIAFIHKPLNFPYHIDLMKGYKMSLEENNIIFDKHLISECSYDGPPAQQSAYQAMKKILKYARIPFGLIIHGDWASLGAVKAIKEKRFRIPEDVGIISYDDLPIVYSVIEPPLAAIRQQVYSMGFKSAELLVQTIRNKKKSYTQIILSTSLVVRDSCS